MKQIRIILASNKKLIVQSIDCVFSYKSGLEVVAKVYKVDQLIDCLKSVPADILLLDQLMLDELYVWKNKTHHTLKTYIGPKYGFNLLDIFRSSH